MPRLTRRRFIGLAAGVAGMTLFGGLRMPKARAAENSLKIWNWSYYIDEALLDEFAAHAGIPRESIVYDEYDDPNVVLSRLEAGKSGYDVVIIPDYILDVAIKEGLLMELNKSLIPNYPHLDEKFKSTPYDPEGRYSAVYMWGTTGFGYRSDLAEKITTLRQIFDPDYGYLKKYSKKITMLEEPIEVILACKAFLGKSVDDWSDETMQEVKEALIRQKPYLAAYAGANVYVEGLKNGSIYVAHAYNGDIVRLQDEEGVDQASFAIPEEGGTIWTDNMCIPKDAENVELAHEFINFMLDPEVSGRNSDYIKYASPVKEARNYVSEEVLENPAVYVPEDLMKKLWFTPQLDEEARRKIENLMIEVKASTVKPEGGIPGFEVGAALTALGGSSLIRKFR